MITTLIVGWVLGAIIWWIGEVVIKWRYINTLKRHREIERRIGYQWLYIFQHSEEREVWEPAEQHWNLCVDSEHWCTHEIRRLSPIWWPIYTLSTEFPWKEEVR